MSVDDIGIRKQLELVRNGKIVDYHDVGAEMSGVDFWGGPTNTPASYVMVIMLTALNDAFKVPLAWFAVTDKFKGPGTFKKFNFNFITNSNKFVPKYLILYRGREF